MNLLTQILQHSYLMFLWGGSVVGILVGAAMLLKPEQLMGLNQPLSRWLDMEKMRVQLDRPRRIEAFIYRHHRLAGAAILSGALFVLHAFMFRYNPRALSMLIPKNYWWLSDALIAIILVSSVLAALMGGMVLTKPCLLRDIEASANRWIDTEQWLTRIGSRHHFSERFVFSVRRFLGVFILLASLYVLIVLGYYLFCGAERM